MFAQTVTQRRVAFWGSGILFGALAALASAQTDAPADEASATALTIYSSAAPGGIPPELYAPGSAGRFRGNVPGYAIVKQERGFELAPGRSSIRFTDVAAQIDPTTVTFASLTHPDTTHVLEQNFQFDLVSQDKLMERYLDQAITVEQSHGESIETITGKLLSTAGGIILQDADGRVRIINQYSNVLFPALPGGLITRPTLVWDVVTDKPGPHRTRVTYQTNGITWWADYNVIFAEGADANSGLLDVGAWVSIINQSGATYRDAGLKLVAGDVHRAPQPKAVFEDRLMRARGAMAEAAPPGFEEKAFFEYHLYTLGRPTTLPDNSTKQLELFETARQVPCEKVLVYYGLAQQYRSFFGQPMTDRNFGIEGNKKVDIYLKFKNEQAVGMGMPLPAGRIRVSKLDPADDSFEFIGEDAIDHTPRDEQVLIKLGTAFDVVGERTQLDFRTDSRRNWMEEVIEIKVRNHKDQPVNVIVKENLYRWVNWEITEKSQPFEKIDARTIHFPVTIEPSGEAVVRYTVRYTW